jgi:ABC-type polysaccharide/polyol phosphate transport system ATPase subunit
VSVATRALVQVEGVSKEFRIPSVRRDTVREHLFGLLKPRHFERLQVLRDVSFAIRRGESVGIMGRNGSGKSTLLKIVTGLYQADGGRVTVHAPLTSLLELGVGWNPDLNAIDNVLLIGCVLWMSLREVKAAVPEILAFAEVERFAELELRHFSSGMASRLAYAVAFRAVRDVLILDEIFAVGDVGFRARCAERYRELQEEGRTILLVSHEPHIVETFCTRALLLDGGRIVREGDPGEVAAEYARRVTHPSSSTP